MARGPQRRIEEAIFEGEIGPISADRLMAKPTVEWEMLRQIITDRRNAKPARNVAVCMMCGDPVYISARRYKGELLPYYSHFGGGDASCPWATGRTIHPDDARASQYQGRQEGKTHEILCQKIAELAALDDRHVATAVNKYRRPTVSEKGRYPDVLVQWRDVGEFAVEFQVSNTFQTEVSARCVHYEREGVPLIWVLYGVDPCAADLPLNFQDIVVRHRCNAFSLDGDAIRASMAAKTLVLQCHLMRPDGSYESPRLVRVDELTFPKRGLPFFEDRFAAPQLAAWDARRRPWRAALRARPTRRDSEELNAPAFLEAHAALSRARPDYAAWAAEAEDNRWLFTNAVAIAFSILSSAAGQFKNYADRQPTLAALLNSKIDSRNVRPFVSPLHMILERSAEASLLQGSVGQHFVRAFDNLDIYDDITRTAAYTGLRFLFPELFEGDLRAQLDAVGALPTWACPDGSLT